MRYGDVAEVPGIGRERFAAFAFSDYLRSGADTALNVMHESDLVVATRRGGELVLSDSPTGLAMVATLPAGDVYDDVLGLVGDGSTAGLSVEFHATDEARSADTRTIRRAALPALGIVDDPAYPASGVEVRALELRRGGRALTGSFLYKQRRTISDRGRGPADPRKREYRRLMTDAKAAVLSAYQARIFSVAFDADASPADVQRVADELAEGARGDARERARRAYREVADPAGVPEIQLTAGRSYDRPIASLLGGTLRLAESPAYGIRFVSRLPAPGSVPYVDELIAQHDQGLAILGVDPIGVIPPPEVSPGALALVPEVEGGDVMIEQIHDFSLRALALVPRPLKGLTDPELQVLTARSRAKRRRVRPWL